MRMSPLKPYMVTKKGPRSATTHTSPGGHRTLHTYMIANVRLIRRLKFKRATEAHPLIPPRTVDIAGPYSPCALAAFIRGDSIGKRHDHVRSGTTRGRLFVQTQEITLGEETIHNIIAKPLGKNSRGL